ncbi:MAG: hypothetical protein AB7G17_09645 [Phycisphaerales bacterium]
MRRFNPRPLILTATALLSVTLVGCSAQQSRLAAYRMNPSPDVDTLSKTHDNIDNRLTITSDTNFRMLNEDIGRALLLDRPSRLSPIPVPY